MGNSSGTSDADAAPGGLGEDLSGEQLEALGQFMLRVSTPVLRDTEIGADPIGTGVLFQVDGRSFLVTANHNFEDMDPEKLAVPLGRFAAPMKTLGTLSLVQPTQANGPDVAVLEIEDANMAAEVGKHWDFLGARHLGTAHHGHSQVVLGYPSQLSRRDGEAVYQQPLAIYSTMIAPPSPEELAAVRAAPLSSWDRFFELERHGTLFDGRLQETPNLKGASGGPIFEIGPCPDGFWSPDKVLRFVGVQTSALEGRWFRGAAADVLEAFFRGVGAIH